MHFRIMLLRINIIKIIIWIHLLTYNWSKMLSSSQNVSLKLSKTTSQKKTVPIWLHHTVLNINPSIGIIGDRLMTSFKNFDLICLRTGWPVIHGRVFLVKSDLSSVRYCTHVHWTSHFFQGTRKTRLCLIGHPVWDRSSEHRNHRGTGWLPAYNILT